MFLFKKRPTLNSFFRKGAEYGLLGLKTASGFINNPVVQVAAKELINRLEKK